MNIKYNQNFGQNTGLQKKLDMTCKQKRSSQITHVNKKTNCRPEGRRNQGRHLKRLPDVCDRSWSTSGPTPWKLATCCCCWWWWWWFFAHISNISLR